MQWWVFQVYDFDTIVRYSVAVIVFLSSFLAVGYTIWWGLLMVVSGWNEQKVKSAVNHMRYAALGIIILVLIVFISPLFLNLFGLSSYGQYFSPGVIFSTIQEISSNILWQGGGGVSYPNEVEVISPSDDGFTEI